MENRNKILDKAKKLKELADRGIGGEKDNAKEMLAKYKAKHNIHIEEITSHNYVNTNYSKMSDEQFLKEILKDMLVIGVGLIFLAIFDKNKVSSLKEQGLNLLQQKYSTELKNRNDLKNEKV